MSVTVPTSLFTIIKDTKIVSSRSTALRAPSTSWPRPRWAPAGLVLLCSGVFRFADYSALDFGVGHTQVDNRSAAAIQQRDSWGGVGTPADYDDSIWYTDHMSRYFEAFGNHNNPNWTDAFLVFDFERLRQAAIAESGCASCYQMPTEFTDDMRTTEKSKSAYVQWTTMFDWSMPLHLALGVRYEETEVVSTALERVGETISWVAANELYVNYADGQSFGRREGKYDYLLPNLDLKLDLSESMVLRGSYSQTIGRPGWGAIRGGQQLANVVRISGGDGSRGSGHFAAEARFGSLRFAGLGPARHRETLWLQGDIAPGSAKDPRRAAVSQRYCVIAMAGDQLGAFRRIQQAAYPPGSADPRWWPRAAMAKSNLRVEMKRCPR